MPQIFQVLRCFKCSVFQVHQTKKSNKFQCKMCGEKQSIKRHYGIGTGKECRLHVQKLNRIGGEFDEQIKNINESDFEEDTPPEQDIKPNNRSKSKWSNFVDEEDYKIPDNEEHMYLDNTEVVLERPAKRKKFKHPKVSTKVNCEISCNYIDKPSNYNDTVYIKNEIVSMPLNNVSNSVPDKTIIKSKQNVFVPPKVDKQSKWAQFTDDSGNCNNLTENECLNELLSTNFNYEKDGDFNNEDPFESVSTSKWSDYTEEIEKENVKTSQADATSINRLFTTCDETELDDILNI